MNIKPKYQFILMDADNTLLDFDKTEKKALIAMFEEEGIHLTRHLLESYRVINHDCWKRFELGQITKPELLVQRFQIFFEKENLNAKNGNDYQRITDRYTDLLALDHFVLPHSLMLCRRLKALGCDLYIVTNGIERTQWSRYRGSGLEKYVTDMFVSETIGVPKPDPKYYQYAFEHIPGFDKERAIIYGDSLSSDIQGAINIGMDSCWFNPKGVEKNPLVAPTYEVASHEAFYHIVKGN